MKSQWVSFPGAQMQREGQQGGTGLRKAGYRFEEAHPPGSEALELSQRALGQPQGTSSLPCQKQRGGTWE